MAMSSGALRSSLSRLAPAIRDADPDAGRKAAQAAWQTHGLVMIRPEWLRNEWDREMLRTLAETVHGKREG
jgi:hypothetical protein